MSSTTGTQNAFSEGFGAAGGILNAYGDIQSGEAKAQALQEQAEVDTQNAAEAIQAGQYNALKSQINSQHVIGAMKASFGAMGVSSFSSSAEAEIASSTSAAELDRLNVLHAADLQATQYQDQAVIDNQAAASEMQGAQNAALGQILQTGASVAMMVA